MASPLTAVLCALIGTAFWSVLGYAIACRVLPRALALGAAPVIGWAVFSAATLPILTLIGFSFPALLVLAALGVVIAGGSLLRPVLWPSAQAAAGAKPLHFTAGAALVVAAAALALVPALALLPKYSAAGVHLAAPIFDHSKIAIIDAMTRQGVPPVNPVFGPSGAGEVAYYYLWHFSAAELALLFHPSGWEADIALTWFTAFASLCLMMAVAVWVGKRAAAALVVVALAASASLRGALSYVAGNHTLEPFLNEPTGFAGWLFQSAWVPQHLMAASCSVVAMLLVTFYAQRQNRAGSRAHSLAYVVTLALVVAAGFESSAFVGGVTFAIAAVAAAPLLLRAIDNKRRLAASLGLVLAALLALGIAAPFIHDQFATVGARHDASPIVLRHFEVLGEWVPSSVRRLLDLPAYWFILLPLEFPATFTAGVLALIALARHADGGPERLAVQCLGVLAAAGLVVAWLLASTVGDNNDLALRAVLPAAMVLIAVAAAGLFAMPRGAVRTAIAASAVAGLVLSVPDSAAMIAGNLRGDPATGAAVFAQTPELWSAVRRHAGAGARVANNPLFLADLTPWPGNMSWALLANRNSCFAGRELAIAFVGLPAERREAINAQFIRVFAGKPMPGDVGELAAKYGCEVVVVVPQDGAWNNDPFAASGEYRLAENREDRWRIYVRVGNSGK
jgi:hypothetical protein